MFDLFRRARELRDAGVLGMNRRNHDYVQALNPRRLYPNVDDKLRTKRLAQRAGLRVPRTLATVTAHHQLAGLPGLLAEHESFVLKPTRGSAGHGILVVSGREGEAYRKPSGARIQPHQLLRHVEDVLSGLYSLGGRPDRAMVEEWLEIGPALAPYSRGGLPDVRVVVYRGFPVMAMTRLPTSDADGKANLHQGAVGVGLCMATGRAVGAIQHDRPIRAHPDTGRALDDLVVPGWRQLVEISARCYEVSGLGYLGVDLVLAQGAGPTVLELNARPGLGIQLANREGLRHRLELVDSIDDTDLMDAEERADLARELFPTLSQPRAEATA